MRPVLVTIVPMLAAAILVMVGGERLAKRDRESRTPFDRERLLDFDEALRTELERLDKLYQSHLDQLAAKVLYQKSSDTRTDASQIVGLKLLRTFRQTGKDLSITPDITPPRLPEIELEGRKVPLNPNNSLVLEKSLVEQALPKSGIWRSTPDSSIRLYGHQPEPGVLVVFLIDLPTVRARTSQHLSDWADAPITPLREAGERLVIDPPQGSALLTMGPDHHGPAASIIPIRTHFGTWQIKAWDGLTVTTSYDPATFAIATTLAAILSASGFFLFAQQKRALKQASERVSFVNRVSHELGTPLTNLSLNLDLATDHLPNPSPEASRRLALVAEEINRLSRLVANVLTFSHRERDTLELKPSRSIPKDIVISALDSFRPALERREIQIEAEIDASLPVLLDPDALKQVTGNLLSNVEKYAASGKWLRLRCHLDADQLTIEVHDRGPGIPADARQRIFAPFERVSRSTSEGSSGTGLGLTIARDLAQRMHGTLEIIESEIGTAFRLSIPAPPALPLVSPDAA